MTQPVLVDPGAPSEHLAAAARIVAVLREVGDDWPEVMVVVLKVATTTDALKKRKR